MLKIHSYKANYLVYSLSAGSYVARLPLSRDDGGPVRHRYDDELLAVGHARLAVASEGGGGEGHLPTSGHRRSEGGEL